MHLTLNYIETKDKIKKDISIDDTRYIKLILSIEKEIYNKFNSVISTDDSLTRQLVSFQANKNRPVYRWYKFKEGFSAELVLNYIKKQGLNEKAKILDPFAGSGTTLFIASEKGIESWGIELLPIGQEIIEARNALILKATKNDFKTIKTWILEKPWNDHLKEKQISILKITENAYPKETEKKIKIYLSRMEDENRNIQKILRFALLCVLESISFTRKDGQCLRWDQRSGRRIGAKPFNKGEIKTFDLAIVSKLKEIIQDTTEESEDDLFKENKNTNNHGKINIIKGSCLKELPKLHNNMFDMVFTSPPYCNRYDYTRTYALELALLGAGEDEINKLRQDMLSCTVENREKNLLDINPIWCKAIEATNNNKLLKTILEYLESKRKNKTLNNNGIPRMVKGYFYEMACVIYELYRVMKKGGKVYMVNDNVRYAGASIAVDLILSKIANELGFNIEKIAVLPKGKGNSSQQMGLHGRETLRKCVYIWRKP
jgi:DNA modification methylase